MKNKIRLIVFIIVITAFCRAYCQTNTNSGTTEGITPQISKKQAGILYEKTKIFPQKTELAVAFIKDGQTFFYGVERIKDSIIYRNNYQDIFEIGSMTKVFTATLLANFVLENKIKLADPVQNYFDFPLANKKITVLQLANHTSGLPKLPSNLNLESADTSNPYKDYDKAKLKEYLTDLEVLNTPGSTYEYSNVGAGILGFLLEKRSETAYSQLLQDYIFSKYNMKNTTTEKSVVKLKLVDGLDSEGNRTANWDLNALVSAGGILSNAEDLSKFAMAQFNDSNKALSLTRQRTFDQSEYDMGVGLGWKIIKPDPSHEWYMHNGGTGRYSSMIALDIEQKNGIIILSNVSAFNENARNIDQLCASLMMTL